LTEPHSKDRERNVAKTYLPTSSLCAYKQLPLRRIGTLPVDVRGDIKGIWSSYKHALLEAHEFLFSLGNPNIVRSACETAKVGKLLPQDFYIHRSTEDQLPAVIRLLVFGARQVVGDLSYDILKISLDGRALSFLVYPNFDTDPHPTLDRAARVYLPKASYAVRHYRSVENAPILHRKDLLVHADYPHYQTFRRLSEQEEHLGLLSAPDIGWKTGWESLLKTQNLAFDSHLLICNRHQGATTSIAPS
jgi:DNA phosphorothioation-associated putative methyltransferase